MHPVETLRTSTGETTAALPSLCEQWKVGTVVMDFDSDLIFFSWVYAHVLLEEINFSPFLPRWPTSLFSCFGRHRFLLDFHWVTCFCWLDTICVQGSTWVLQEPLPCCINLSGSMLHMCSGNLPWLKVFNYGTSPLLVYNVLMDPGCTRRMD